jgi:hypothetical protein
MQDQVKAVGEHNPFTKMGIVKFWAISTIVYLTFPVSLIVSYIAFGPTFDQTACYRLCFRIFCKPACCDRGFDYSDLGNRSLFGTHTGWMVWWVTATTG